MGEMALVDTHLHLDFEQFAEDRDAVVERAQAAGVTRLITIGIDVATSRSAIGLAERYPGVYASVGIHPNGSGDWDGDETVHALREMAAHRKVVAIGEIGLDYYWERVAHEQQARVFQAQLELAAQAGLPVVIHDRDAHDDVMAHLRDWAPAVARERPPGVLHCFSGNRAMAEEALALGFSIGIDGPVTFKKARDLQGLVAALPLEKIVIETDAPFLAPHPYRGKRNEPAYVVEVARKIAEVRGLPVEVVVQQTTENARVLFGLE